VAVPAADAAAADGGTGPEPPAPVLDAGFLGWLADPRDPAAGAFWDMLVLVRELGSGTPRRDSFAPGEGAAEEGS